jgi:hypothetical protein
VIVVERRVLVHADGRNACLTVKNALKMGKIVENG